MACAPHTTRHTNPSSPSNPYTALHQPQQHHQTSPVPTPPETLPARQPRPRPTHHLSTLQLPHLRQQQQSPPRHTKQIPLHPLHCPRQRAHLPLRLPPHHPATPRPQQRFHRRRRTRPRALVRRGQAAAAADRAELHAATPSPGRWRPAAAATTITAAVLRPPLYRRRGLIVPVAACARRSDRDPRPASRLRPCAAGRRGREDDDEKESRLPRRRHGRRARAAGCCGPAASS